MGGDALSLPMAVEEASNSKDQNEEDENLNPEQSENMADKLLNVMLNHWLKSLQVINRKD